MSWYEIPQFWSLSTWFQHIQETGICINTINLVSTKIGHLAKSHSHYTFTLAVQSIVGHFLILCFELLVHYAQNIWEEVAAEERHTALYYDFLLAIHISNQDSSQESEAVQVNSICADADIVARHPHNVRIPALRWATKIINEGVVLFPDWGANIQSNPAICQQIIDAGLCKSRYLMFYKMMHIDLDT